MDLKDLRCLVAVAEARSFTRAAEKLYMTQPALSRTINHLEQELGLQLFDRDARPITLTRAGEVFYDRARRMLKLEKGLYDDMNRLKSGQHLRLSIEYGMAGHVPLLTQALIKFKKRYPDAIIDVHRQYNALAIQELLDRRCDLCIINRPDFPEGRGLTAQAVTQEGVYAFVPSTHPYYNRDMLTLEDFHGQRVCIFERFASPNMFDKILAFFSDRGIILSEIGQAPDTPTFTMMLLLNNQIGIMPRNTMNEAPTQIREIPILDTAGMDVLAVWQEENRNQAIQAFLEILD